MKQFTLTKILFVIFLFFNLSNQAISQDKTSGGEGYFMIGMQKIDVKNLNTLLKQYNYPALDENYVSLGGGGYGIVNNFVIGGEGHGLIGSTISNANYKLNSSAGYGVFNVGYVIYHNYGLKIFPLIGFGGGGIDLTIYEKSSLDFNDIMHNPKRGSSLSLGGLMFNLGLNGTYKLDFSGKDKGDDGLLIGFSAGYTHFLKLGNWTLFENEISGGPKIGISGFYLRFSIGGGGGMVKYSESE